VPVARGAEQQLLLERAMKLCDHAEIEQDDATRIIDQDVRRLHVAVDLARRVQRAEPARETRERGP
jgi:hypothetical protein